MTSYPYAAGDLIETPNTYFYSQYGGRAFVTAWRDDRNKVLRRLPEAVAPLPPQPADPDSRLGLDLLERALAGDIYRLVARKGFAAVEIGAEQDTEIKGIFLNSGLEISDSKDDLNGIRRCLIATPVGELTIL